MQGVIRRLRAGRFEEQLRIYLHRKVLWLLRNLSDETNEHVDNVCTFPRPGEVVLAWTDDETDPQYPLSQQTLAYLEGETGWGMREKACHSLSLIPDHPVCIGREELAGYSFV